MEAVSPRLSNSSTTDGEFSSGGGAHEANNAVELSSPRSCSVEPLRAVGGGSGDRTVVQYFNNFKKSGVPCRFLVFEQNAWVDLPKLVFDELTAGFVAGKAVFELSVYGRCYLFDFLRMVRIDTSTEAASSIAWIDVDGRCFFPRTVVVPESYNQYCRRKEMALEIGDIDKSFSDESTGLARPRFSGAEMLGEGERLYRVVRKLFLNGMRRAFGSSDAVAVTSVHKCSYPGLSGRSRLKAFQMMMGMAKEARGDANVKFGWYGASARSSVADVVQHGFGKPNSGELGFGAHGLGVHLSPPQYPHGSSLLCREEAEGGEKYMVLCRFVMGNVERVEAGSLQCHPSSDDFDSGVDDLDNPKWYVVWSTRMNTHIIPEYVVSFKTYNHPQGTRRAAAAAAAAAATRRAPPVGTWLSFPKLLREIGKSLPSPKTRALERLYNQHKVGKMSKDVLIRYIRSIVGDKLLASTIRRIR